MSGGANDNNGMPLFSSGGRSDKVVGKRRYSSYYSGTDIRVFLGDYWADEIVEIEFSMIEQTAPIYGYASHTFDKVARGNRIVQGQFSINFKETGYLQTVLNSLSSKQSKDEWFNKETFFNYKGKNNKNVAGNHNKSVEAVIKNFQELADDYEKALWGEKSNASKLVKGRSEDTFFYGTRSNENMQSMRDHGFNIMITYGAAPGYDRGNNNFKTKQTIVGVQLTGFSTRVDPSGQPVQEVYSFIAKDISGDVSSSS